MRVLLSASACSPRLGSEAQFGWNTLLAASEIADEVHLLGHDFNRRDLLDAKDGGQLPPNVHLHFAGIHRPFRKNRILARLASWQAFHDWNHAALPLALELHRRHPFDLVHHATVASWRVASGLWQLDIPFVWGPLGGGEMVPRPFYRYLSLQSRCFEILRVLQGAIALRTPSIRACARHACALVAANNETARVLGRLSRDPEKPRLLSPASFSSEHLNLLGQGMEKPACPPLKLFAGGDIEGRKGIALALEALARFRRDHGGKFVYQIAGTGAERSHLENLSASLGLSDWVTFTNPLRQEEYFATLHVSHAYLLPSLRDSAGLTLLEAMAAGCVPIVADCGGPGMVIDSRCGFKIPSVSPSGLIEGIVQALIEIQADPGGLGRMGDAARETVRRNLSRAAFVSSLREIYNQACQ